MKRIFIVWLLTVSTISLCAEEYYKSNILGMKLEQVDGSIDKNIGWILEVINIDDVEKLKLYDDGKIFFERTVNNDGVKVVTTTLFFDKRETEVREKGAIISEKVERTGVPAELTEYKYDGRRLVYTDFFLNDEKIYRENYNYSYDGRLMDVSRVFESDGSKMHVSFVFNNGKMSRYWYKSDDETNYIKFNRNGIVLNDSYGEGSGNELREYGELSNGRRYELITYYDTGIKKSIIYNKDNKIVLTTISDENDEKTEETSWIYEAELVKQIKIKTELSLEQIDFFYDREGKPIKEIYKKNGNIIQITEYKTEIDYTEKLYRQGLPVLLITYKDGIRVETEHLQER